MGRALGKYDYQFIGRRNEIKEAIEELGLDLNVIEDQEPDAALLEMVVLVVLQPAS